MANELKCLRFMLTEKEMFQFLLKQVIDTKTNDGEPFSIQMTDHTVKTSHSKVIINVNFEATVGKETIFYATENGSLISVDNGANFMGSVDLKVFKEIKEE